MQKWDYQIVVISRKGKALGGLTNWEPQFDMKKFGESGWELVSAVPIAGDYSFSSGVTTQIAYYFKKPKEE
jgi:hypothetical protein